MEIQAIRQRLESDLADAQKVLVGIGAEWREKEETCGAAESCGDPVEDRGSAEKARKVAAEALRALLKDKDHFIITTLSQEEILKLGFEKDHIVAPLDVSLTEQEWNHYMEWLAGTLNKKTVLLELGEGFEHPSLIRWPFEKTALLNYKAYLYRVHGKFYHITDELKEKAVAVNMDSVQFLAGRKEE